ncbi:hypothetical protein BC628DRAFT_1341180 [Trametes gibbosa]|nr:hypothetical protein BC628DRAFT_1341180 [Trametes gibbosa]
MPSYTAPSVLLQAQVERRSLRSPPPKPKSRSQVSRPPVPPLPLEFVKSQSQSQPKCLVTRQAHVRIRNRERKDLNPFKPLVDGGANYRWKLISLRDARRRDSIVYHGLPARV